MDKNSRAIAIRISVYCGVDMDECFFLLTSFPSTHDKDGEQRKVEFSYSSSLSYPPLLRQHDQQHCLHHSALARFMQEYAALPLCENQEEKSPVFSLADHPCPGVRTTFRHAIFTSTQSLLSSFLASKADMRQHHRLHALMWTFIYFL